MRDCLLLVDLFDDFGHEDGDALLASFEARREGMVELLHAARRSSVPVVYANDSKGIFDGDARKSVEGAIAGPAGSLLEPLLPEDGDRFVVKPRYSTVTASSSSPGTRPSTPPRSS